MRDNVRAFVEIATRCFGLRGPVYEFGSYQVEDQEDRADLRALFGGQKYVGCDMRSGPGVDRVEDLAELTLPDASAQTILCVDTLEHVFEVRRAVEEMLRVLAPGGLILLAAPLDFRVHDFPSDYWRLTPSCMARLLAPLDGMVIGWQGVESFPHTVFGIGAKPPAPAPFAAGATRFVAEMESWLQRAEAAIGWPRRLKRLLTSWVRSKGERRRQRDFHRAQFAIHLPASAPWKLVAAGAAPAAGFSGGRVDLL